jgi:hypothetical protein
VPRFIRPARKGIETLLTEQLPQVPEVDMSSWRSSERKEIGSADGSASGDPLLTTAQLNDLLGEVSPGLKLGDEIRLSGYLANYTNKPLEGVEIKDSSGVVIVKSDQINPGEKLCFLDRRQIVSSVDLLRGYVSMEFQWSSKGVVCVRKVLNLSTKDGLPVDPL